MLNRYNFASSSFEFSTFLSSRNAKKIACSPHFHLLHLSGVILQDYSSNWHWLWFKICIMLLEGAVKNQLATYYVNWWLINAVHFWYIRFPSFICPINRLKVQFREICCPFKGLNHGQGVRSFIQIVDHRWQWWVLALIWPENSGMRQH